MRYTKHFVIMLGSGIFTMLWYSTQAQPTAPPQGSNCNITFVGIGDMTNISGKTAAYTDYSPLGTQFSGCGQYPLSVRVNTGGDFTVYVRAWFDWDNDGTFNGPDEQVDLGTATNVTDGSTTLAPAPVNVPSNAVTTVKMRVAVKWGGYPGMCETAFAGEVEDYTVTVQRERADVCLITVDSTSQYNIIVWEKPQTAVIDSFIVYREFTQGNFQRIGAVAYSADSQYDDYDADPNVTAYRYRISTLDTCGQESALSPFHNSIHLQQLGNGNLLWSHYAIEGQTSPVDFYRVYRDDFSNGNFQPISLTVPGGNNSYTDVNYSSYPNASYVVDVAWDLSCDPNRVLTTTRSNRYSGLSVGVENPDKLNVQVYPNPGNGLFTLVTSDEGTVRLNVTDIAGREVLHENCTIVPGTPHSIDISQQSNGVYTLSIGTEDGTSRVRLVKE